MLYTYKRTNKEWFGHMVYNNQLVDYCTKIPAYQLVWTKNGYQYKTIDSIKRQ